MANPSMVQSIGNNSLAGGVTSWSQAFSSQNTQGNAIFAAGLYTNLGTPSISDTQNNPWTVLSKVGNFNSDTLVLGYALNVAGGANTVTLRTGGSSATGIIYSIGEVSNVNAVDGSGSSSNNSFTPPWTGGGVTANYTPEMLISVFFNSSNASPSIWSPFTSIIGGGGNYGDVGYDVVSSTGTYSSTVSGSTGAFINLILGFYNQAPASDMGIGPSMLATMHGARG